MITHKRSRCERRKVKPALRNNIATYAAGCTYKSRWAVHLDVFRDVSNMRKGKRRNNYLDTGNLLWSLPRSFDAVSITKSQPPQPAQSLCHLASQDVKESPNAARLDNHGGF